MTKENAFSLPALKDTTDQAIYSLSTGLFILGALALVAGVVYLIYKRQFPTEA
jgi:hypothetical protein